jgi:hypothetical protein
MRTVLETGLQQLIAPVSFSRHARLRLAHRCLSEGDIEYVVEYGEPFCRTGVTFFVLRGRDIPPHDRRTRLARLEGTVVLMAPDGQIVTAYRDRWRAASVVRRKVTYRRVQPIQARAG